MTALLLSILASPGTLWLEALSEAHWAEEYTFVFLAEQSSTAYSGVLPEPVLQGSLAGAPVETRNGPVLGSFGITQRVPWPGLLSASRHRANAQTTLAEEQKTVMELRMRTAIATAWAEAYRREQRERIFSERAQYLSSLLTSAAGSSAALTLEPSALADLRIRTELARQKPVSERNSLAASLGQLEALAGSGTDEVFEIPPLEWFSGRVAAVEVSSPALRIAELSVASSEASLDVVKAGNMPAFVLGASYSPVGMPRIAAGAVSPGADSWMVSLGVTIPLGYSGAGAKIDQAEFLLASANARMLQMEEEVSAKLASEKALLVNLVDEISLLMELLPVSVSAVQSAASGWAAGRGSYGTLISTLQSNLDIQMEIAEKEALLVGAAARWLELAGAATQEGEFL